MIQTRCILKPRARREGTRISIMSRHTLSDGITTDERITKELFDEHDTRLAPHPRIIGAYYRQNLTWEEFAELYIKQITKGEISQRALAELIVRSRHGETLTLLCVEESPERCHRKLLMHILREFYPEVERGNIR